MTPAEQRLMAELIAHPERDFGTVELLQHLGTSRSAGSSVINRWVQAGALRERRVGNQRRLSANPDYLLYEELRRMALKTVALTEPLAHALAPIADRLTQAFVFGSVAAGQDTNESDVDLALVGDIDLFTVSPLLDPLEHELGRSIHVNVYDAQEWMAKNDPVLKAIKSGPRWDLMEVLRAQAG